MMTIQTLVPSPQAVPLLPVLYCLKNIPWIDIADLYLGNIVIHLDIFHQLSKQKEGDTLQ